ncbi:hypothetical protein AB3K78_01200 [Leucobacter sp. HNU]|uniref:hypothetical protein n=1 Tax=Leucobacter sp. HNU TaxID=3236805 RepID=UPI003A80D40D
MNAKALRAFEVGMTVVLLLAVLVGLTGAFGVLFSDPETVLSGVWFALLIGAFLILLAIPTVRRRRAAVAPALTTQREPVDVTVTRSEIDGALLIQIDTEDETGHLRIDLNDGTIWDADPEGKY